MKKFLALILAALLIAGCFAGCGAKKENNKKEGNKKSPPKQSSTSTKEETATKKPVKGEPMELEFSDCVTFDNTKVIVSSDESIVRASGSKIRALKLTDEPVAVAVHKKDGSVENYSVTVKKAKIHIAVICGQSNADGATNGASQQALEYNCTKLDEGTAFIWNAGSTSPSDYYGGSKTDGFKAGLAKQWYEQSKLAGAPEKTCFVYQTSYTAYSGEVVSEFLNDNSLFANVKKTAKMFNACYDYYTNGNGKDNFEVVSCEMYWLQGESDSNTATPTYKSRFTEMWSRLKTETNNKLNYCGIMRVRKGGFDGLEDFPPHVAHKELVAENNDIHFASLITENWHGGGSNEVTMDTTNFHIFGEEQYKDMLSNNTFKTQVKLLYAGLHYAPLGFNIIGADAAINMYQVTHKAR